MIIFGPVVGLVSFVIFIVVLIKQFQVGGPLHGIIGIVTCGLWTFIWGWINANKLNIQSLMLIWTLILAANVILNIFFGTLRAILHSL
jgi:hypothetical protein